MKKINVGWPTEITCKTEAPDEYSYGLIWDKGEYQYQVTAANAKKIENANMGNFLSMRAWNHETKRVEKIEVHISSRFS